VGVCTAAERLDLWLGCERFFGALWPEYNGHGDHVPRYFGVLLDRHADLQVLVTDERTGEVVGRGRTIPFRWDGTLGDLPDGIDALGLRAVDDVAAPNAISALAAEVHPDYRGQRLSGVVIETMAAAARARSLTRLVAPVRPMWKDRYPITPIEDFARWRRPDGLPFDPWIRVHELLGGKILRTEPKSMAITAPVSDWEQWVGIDFPEDGDYVFPEGLAPLSVVRGTGFYWEPNVWLLHNVESDLGVMPRPSVRVRSRSRP
jgi:hypothetical protein